MTTLLQANISAVVTGAGLTLNFMTVTGGDITRDTAKSRDPGARFPRAVPAPADIGNVTVGGDYDRTAFANALPHLRSAASAATEFAIARVDRDASGNAVGTTTYTGIIVHLTEPTGDTNGGANKATVGIEFAVSGVV